MLQTERCHLYVLTGLALYVLGAFCRSAYLVARKLHCQDWHVLIQAAVQPMFTRLTFEYYVMIILWSHPSLPRHAVRTP